jgi:hypothetical protein
MNLIAQDEAVFKWSLLDQVETTLEQDELEGGEEDIEDDFDEGERQSLPQ